MWSYYGIAEKEQKTVEPEVSAELSKNASISWKMFKNMSLYRNP